MKIIQKKAFGDCTHLTKVTNNSPQVVIEEKAFVNCVELKEVLTNKKTGFSSEAFKGCASGLDFFKIEC